jgi:hypothetical protein
MKATGVVALPDAEAIRPASLRDLTPMRLDGRR